MRRSHPNTVESRDATVRVPAGVLTALQRIRRELPHLCATEAADLARVVRTLTRVFRPERIYVFGSQARGVATWASDVDLLVIVPAADEPPFRLSQQAFAAIGDHLLPLDIVFMTRDEFAWRSEVVTSLPATVLREGRTLYAVAAA